MFSKIVAMLVMACALLMGAPAWAQAPVGIEKTHRASENVGTLWETCVRLFTLEKATAKCWMNTLRLKADGSLERVDPTNVKAGEILYFGIPTPVLKEEAQKALGGAQVHSNTVGTTDNAKAGVVPAPAKPLVSQDTAPEATKPQSNVLPETNALAPLAAPSVPTLTEDLVFQTPEQINPETGTSVPVISGAAEVSSSDKFLENFLRTSLFSVILILTIISMFMGAEYRNDLGYFSKLSSISRKPTLKVVDSREELEAMSKEFYAQSAQASKARKPRTDLTAPIKRFVANGGQIATDFGKKVSSFFARPGVKTQKAKKEKWAGKPKPVEGPPMTSPMPTAKIAPKPPVVSLTDKASEVPQVGPHDWWSRVNSPSTSSAEATSVDVPKAKWYQPKSGLQDFRYCYVEEALRWAFSATGMRAPMILWFREMPDGQLQWFDPVAEKNGENPWRNESPRRIEGRIGGDIELHSILGIELSDEAIRRSKDPHPGRILEGNGISVERIWEQMPPRGTVVPLHDPTKELVDAK